MFNPFIRTLLISACFAFGLFYVFSGYYQGGLYLLAGLLLLWSAIRSGEVWQAWRAFQQGNLEKMSHHLDRTRSPQRLSRPNRAYYNWMDSARLAHQEKFEEAYEVLKKAEKGPFKTIRTDFQVQVSLADLAFRLGRNEDAEHHLCKAEKMMPSDAYKEAVEKMRERGDGT